MKTLKAAVAIRILDSLGVVSKEMVDIRNDNFLKVYKDDKFYSGRVNYSEKESLVFIYTELENNDKYMTAFVETDNGGSGEFVLCIVSGDVIEESPDLNKLIIGTKSLKFREVSYLESAKFLNTFEVIRNHMPNWEPNDPDEKSLKYLIEFMKIITIE